MRLLVYMFIYYHITTTKEYTIHVMQRKNFEIFPFSVCPLTNLGPNFIRFQGDIIFNYLTQYSQWERNGLTQCYESRARQLIRMLNSSNYSYSP